MILHSRPLGHAECHCAVCKRLNMPGPWIKDLGHEFQWNLNDPDHVVGLSRLAINEILADVEALSLRKQDRLKIGLSLVAVKKLLALLADPIERKT